MLKKLIFFGILVLILLNFVSSATVDKEILNQFNAGEEKVNVIIEKQGIRDGFKIMENPLEIDKIAERGNKIIAEVTFEQLEDLKENSEILNVRQNIPIQTFMQDIVKIVGANNTWNLKVNSINLTGHSQSVCILDTGINNSHLDFENRILEEKCFCTVSDSGSGGCCPDGTEEDENAIDDHGHGTNVAGIVAAQGRINGIGTEIGLVIVKIMNATGQGNSLDLEDGIQWCLDNAEAYNISVITASLGGGIKYGSQCDSVSPTLTAKINNAFSKGISMTIATGNNGWNDGITWPACITNATPIGAVDKSDSIAYNRNPLLKLLGVGVNVNSTSLDGNYELSSGTSMATPVVAGAIAIFNQLLNLTSRIKTPLEIEDIFYSTGKNISDSGNYYSRINVYDSVLAFDNILPNVTLISPAHNKISSKVNQTFECSAEDWQLKNNTLYIWNLTGLYYNETKSLKGIDNFSLFNVTDIPSGDYFWNCLVYDNQSNFDFASSNYSFSIGEVSVTLSNLENNTWTNHNKTNFTCQLATEDAYILDNVTFYLWNSSGLIYNETEFISGTHNESTFNYTFVKEENYYWNCFLINNNSNEMWAERNYSISYDISKPSIDLIDPVNSASYTSNSELINFEYNVSDNFNIDNCTLIINSLVNSVNSSIVNLSQTQIFTKSFSPGNYNWSINCFDKSGNLNSSLYTRDFSIASPPSSSGGGGSSSSTSNEEIVKQLEYSEFEVISGLNRTFEIGEEIQIALNSETHDIVMDEVGDYYATFTITSEPQRITLLVGGEQKISLTQGEYNLLIKLISIDSGIANLEIVKINEQIKKISIPIMIFEENESGFDVVSGKFPTNFPEEDYEIDWNLIWNIVTGFIFALLVYVIFHIFGKINEIANDKTKIKRKIVSKKGKKKVYKKKRS